ncbi:outer membrane protein Omp18 [Helicobacter pylori]|uniref:outer membrane protein Omp18 n=1 Tax=Helicobacter pylori TaxID=210 RepID=UPI0019235303|nr:outer membrane protein Omp18 [Helicobacter pylori]QQW79572.1 outer membrane protein Omp18 [Helicobacter pylori]
MKRSSVFSFLVTFLLVAGCSHKMDNKTVAGDVSTKTVQTAPVTTEPAPEKEEPKQEPAPVVEEKPAVESGTIIASIYFDFDKYEIKESDQETLDEIVQKAKENHMQVLLEGNTDEFGSSEYNQALGVKRTLSVKNALIIKGVEKDMIKTISFGETKPKCVQKTRECYRENRRVDVKLVK